MFKWLLQGPRTAPLLKRAFDDVDRMLRTNARMFDVVTVCFLEGCEPAVDIEYLDEDVNIAERLVRRMVFEHLTLDPKQNLTSALVLLSIVHDAERVGDYIKAVLRVMHELGFVPPKGRYRQDLADLIDGIRPLFDSTRTAFNGGDEASAHAVVSAHTRNRERARAILHRVIDDEFIDRRQTILVTSGSRSLKRVSAHLANIASSVVHPFDKIGHKDEDA